MQLRVYSEVTLYTNDRYLTDRNNRFRDLGWPRLASRLASKTEHETRFDHLPTYLCRLAWKYQKNIYLHLPHLPISCLKPTCSIEFSAMYVRAVLPDPLNKFCSHSMRWTSARCILSKWCCILFGQISEWNQINAHTLAPTRKKASKNLIAASVTSKKLPNVYKSCPKWFC